MRRSAPEELCLVSGQHQTVASSTPQTYPHLCLPYLPVTKSLLYLYTHTHSGQMIVTEHQMICSAGIDQRSWIAQSLNQEHYDPKIKLKVKDIL